MRIICIMCIICVLYVYDIAECFNGFYEKLKFRVITI